MRKLGYGYTIKEIHTKIKKSDQNMLHKGDYHVQTHYPSRLRDHHRIPPGYKRWTVCDGDYGYITNEMPIIVSQDSTKQCKEPTLKSKVLCLSWWDASFGIHPDKLEQTGSNPYVDVAKRFIIDIYNLHQYAKPRKIPEYLWEDWDRKKKKTNNPHAHTEELQYIKLDKHNVAIYDVQHIIKMSYKIFNKECDFEPLNIKEALLYEALDILDEFLEL